MRRSTADLAAASLVVLALALPIVVDPWFELTAEAAKAALLLSITTIVWIDALVAPREVWARLQNADRRILLSVVLLLLIATAANLRSDSPERSFFGTTYWRGGLLTMLCQCALMCAVVTRLPTRHDIDTLISALMIGSTPVCAYAALQFAGLDLVTWSLDHTAGGRSASTLGSPIVLGGYLAMLLPLGVARLLRPDPGQGRRMLVLAVLLQAVALATTVSRGPWLAAVVGLGVAVVTASAVPGRHLVRIALPVALIGAVILSQRAGLETGWVRLGLWRESAVFLLERPLLGFGQESFSATFPYRQSAELRQFVGGGVWIDHAHNLWLDTAFEIGIPGALILAGLLLWCLVTAVRRARHSVDRDDLALWAGLAGSLAAFAVHGLFMFSTIVPTTLFWLIVGVVARPMASGTAPETDDRQTTPATI